MRYVLGILGIGVILIMIFVLVINRNPSPSSQQGVKQVNLSGLAASPATAIYTMDGQLNAEEEHRAVRISVDRNQRKIEILSGYSETVINSKTWSNTQSAYDQFLHALENAGFARQQKAQYPEEKGVCPLGNRYIYELREFNDERLRLWSTSCGRREGSFGGNPTLIRQLFQKQIPASDYKQITTDVRL